MNSFCKGNRILPNYNFKKQRQITSDYKKLFFLTWIINLVTSFYSQEPILQHDKYPMYQEKQMN
jgi:hypothetical protein